MIKGRVIFEDEGEKKIKIKYPCYELKDIVEYFFEVRIPSNSTTPFSIIALPNVNIVVSIYLSDKSQTFKFHREYGISDTTGDKICGSLTEAITVMQAPGTHEFAIKFKPGVMHSCLYEKIQILVDNHLPLSEFLDQEVVEELKLKQSFNERVEFVEAWLIEHLSIFKGDFKLNIVTKAIYYINNCRDYKANIVSKQVGISTSTLNRYFKVTIR